MSTPQTTRVSHNLYPLVLLLLLIPALACKALTPSTPTPAPPASAPEASEGTRISYPTGIETIRLDSGNIVVADQLGSYCMAFPMQWEVGAVHEDFIPTVDKYAQTHRGIKLLFDALYGKDNSLRIFAIDTSPGHLTKDNLTVLHVGMFQEEWRLKLSLDDLTREYMAYVTSSGEMKIKETLLGKTKYEVPYVVLLTESVPAGDISPVYGEAVLVKTDQTYLEMIYSTLAKSINIVEELYPILNSFAACQS